MVVQEEREEAAEGQPSQTSTQSQFPPLPRLVPVAAVPAAHLPGMNLKLARGLTREWNAEHGQAMRVAEAVIGLGVMAYFATGLLGVLGIL